MYSNVVSEDEHLAEGLLLLEVPHTSILCAIEGGSANKISNKLMLGLLALRSDHILKDKERLKDNFT